MRGVVRLLRRPRALQDMERQCLSIWSDLRLSSVVESTYGASTAIFVTLSTVEGLSGVSTLSKRETLALRWRLAVISLDLVVR